MSETCAKCKRHVKDYRDGRGWIHTKDGTPERDCFGSESERRMIRRFQKYGSKGFRILRSAEAPWRTWRRPLKHGRTQYGARTVCACGDFNCASLAEEST